MTLARGPEEPGKPVSSLQTRPRFSLECELFESLVHHLFEKGVLTRNDALSVVQTVAEVKQGAVEEAGPEATALKRELQYLQCLYRSFEYLPEQHKPLKTNQRDGVVLLRPPVHGDRPSLPDSD